MLFYGCRIIRGNISSDHDRSRVASPISQLTFGGRGEEVFVSCQVTPPLLLLASFVSPHAERQVWRGGGEGVRVGASPVTSVVLQAACVRAAPGSSLEPPARSGELARSLAPHDDTCKQANECERMSLMAASAGGEGGVG